MKYPTLPVRGASREVTDAFRGYNHNLRIGSGEFFDMKNMTGDFYPLLSPRRKRGRYGAPENPQGLIAKDALCFIDGTDFVMNEYRVDLGLSEAAEDCPKQLTSMGAYVIILPDRKWINTMDLTQHGSIDASFTSAGEVSFSLCSADGTEYAGYTASAEEPAEPENQQLWLDTGMTPASLKQWSDSSSMWVSIASTYVKIFSPGLGAAFSQHDGVTLSGIQGDQLQELNGSHVVWARDTDWIVVTGLLNGSASQQEPVSVARRMPDVDYLIESGNRLWGCRYGMTEDGQVVNEIYASKLGDFKNWQCYMNTSTDSYRASCGTDGRFTGAITHLGYPLFFKENFVHKVYGSFPANFQIQVTPLRGVQRGCHRSLAIVNEVLYYKAQSGICAYDGSLPREVSSALGQEGYEQATAGSYGNKYYVSMRSTRTGEWNLFVLDTSMGIWHREDDLAVAAFCRCRNELYAIADGQILTMMGSGTADSEPVRWMATSGEIGVSSPDTKYLSRLTVRMGLPMGSEVRFLARYDSRGDWVILGVVQGSRLHSFSLSLRPVRCDHLVLRMEGTGDAKIYSITKTMEQGSEIP